MPPRPTLTEALDAAAFHTRAYARGALRPDLIAGLTVAMIAVPQSMAYAQLAGMPPIYGLYSVILPAIVGALFGSSSHLITGASNATALATAGVLVAFLAMPEYPEYAFVMAILTGIIRLAMGLLKLGFIMRYVSNSVLTGLLAAIGTLIIINQLPTLLGIARPASASTIGTFQALAAGMGSVNPYILGTGLFAMFWLLVLRWLGQRTGVPLPGPLLSLVLAAALVALLGWHERGVSIAADISDFTGARPRFHLPQVPLEAVPALLPGALALAFFSLMEAINIAKAIGMSAGERVDASREFTAQGLASLVGGFFQSFPTSGSPARTTVNFAAGAKTRLAAMFSGLFVWVALLAFARWIGLIPNAGLAGVLIISAAGVFNIPHIRMTWQSGLPSRLVMGITYLSALLLPLHYAIYTGMGLSILIYLFGTSRLRMSYLTVNQDGSFVEHSMERLVLVHPRVALINVEGPLYFGATEDLERKLIQIFHSGVKVVILRMRRVHLLASTGITVLENILRQANRLGILVLFSGVTGEVETVLRGSGLTNLLGPGQTFPASQTLFAATREALKRAREYVGEG